MKNLLTFLGEGIWQLIVFPLIYMGYGALCFVIFDFFHITDLGVQILIAIAPFLVLAYFVWKRQIQWDEHETAIEKSDTDN